MIVTVTVMLSIAILVLLGAVVNQNKKITDLEMKFDIYKDATYGRTKELDDMYQNLNSRMNKHIIEHIMKGRL